MATNSTTKSRLSTAGRSPQLTRDPALLRPSGAGNSGTTAMEQTGPLPGTADPVHGQPSPGDESIACYCGRPHHQRGGSGRQACGGGGGYAGQWLYISITLPAEFPGDATIYRIRLVDHPTAADMELVHRFVASPDPTVAGPQATGLAFARSGNLYVSLLGPNQVAVLDPAGNEIRRISDPRFHSPWGLAFLGNKLLVTNGDLEPGDNPDAWKVFTVDVGETGLPLNRPRVPVN